MKRTRHVLAVALVATALCADRAIAAAPTVRADMAATAAGRLVTRLSVRFRRVVPSVRLYQSRQDALKPAAAQTRIAPDFAPATPHQSLLDPFQFRLPPPAF